MFSSPALIPRALLAGEEGGPAGEEARVVVGCRDSTLVCLVLGSGASTSAASAPPPPPRSGLDADEGAPGGA